MIQERSKPTFLRRLHPNTKLWMALGLTFAVVFFQNVWFSAAVLIASVVMVAVERYALEFKVILVAIGIMALFMFTINGTLNPVNDYTGTPVFTLPLLGPFYREGLQYALYYFMRIAPLMASLFLLFRTINMTDLGVGMIEGGLSYRASFMFVSSFQIIPVLGKDMGQIMDAQRARGLDTDGNLLKRFMAFIPVIVPLVANSIMKVQDQAVAMETKGFNSSAAKTIYRDLERRPVDAILKWASIALAAAAAAIALARAFGAL